MRSQSGRKERKEMLLGVKSCEAKSDPFAETLQRVKKG